MPSKVPSFAQQRIVYLALLLGMTVYAIAAAFVLQWNGGNGLAEDADSTLQTLAALTGGILAVAAILTRVLFRIQANRVSGDARAGAMFTSVLLPLALLEGGCLFATTVWMLSGKAVPCLAVAMVLLAIAIAVVPFSDTDAA